MRIGVIGLGDPANPATWSGTPAGIIQGLNALRIEAVPMSASPTSVSKRTARTAALSVRYLRPGNVRVAIDRAREAAMADPMMAAAQMRAANRALRRAGTLDGIIQIGSDFRLETCLPLVSFEDMTVAQVVRNPYPGWELLSSKSVDRRIATQRALYEQATACCVATPWAANSVINDYGVPAEKVHVVGLGSNRAIPTNVIRDWSSPKFLFVGSHWERKNGDGVLTAFSALRPRYPEAQLDVVGAHPPIRQPGVIAHGTLRLAVQSERRKLDALFAAATCFVMPSYAEAAGIVFIEAAEAGIPAIGSTAGGADFLIGDGGTTVDPSDHRALFDAMTRLADPDTARRAGDAAKKRSELYSWKLLAERLLRGLQGAPTIPVSEEFGFGATTRVATAAMPMVG